MTNSTHLRASASCLRALQVTYEANATNCGDFAAAQAWNAAVLRLADAIDEMEVVADSLDGIWTLPFQEERSYRVPGSLQR